MKVIKSLFFGSLLLFSVFSYSASAESVIPYCTEVENSVCVSPHDDLVDFLNNLDGSYYYEPSFYNPNNGYIVFEDAYFEYYIPDYLVEWILIDLDYGTYFGKSDWEKIDTDFNKVPDDIDDLVDLVVDVRNYYFGDSSQYKFDRWEDKIPIVFDYVLLDSLYDDGNCAFGFFNGQIHIDPTGVLDDDMEVLEYCGGNRDKSDVKSTIAHEVFHAIQYVYLGEDLWAPYQQDNFIEGTAVMMQRNVSSSDQYLDYLSVSPYLYPNESIFGPTESRDITSYGSFVWYNFLERNYGKDIVEKLFEGYQSISGYDSVYRSFLAVADALEKDGSSIEEAYLEFVTWNFDKDKYTYGSSMRDVYITNTHKSYPTNEIVVDDFDEAPALFGSSYIEFSMGDGTNNLVVEFVANLDADMYVSFLSVNDDEVDYDKTVEYFVERGTVETFTVPGYGNDVAVMIVSVLDVDAESLETANVFADYIYPFIYSADRVSVVAETIESEVSLDEVDLDDYFIFTIDKYWEYSGTTEYSSGELENIDLRVETNECTLVNGCVTYHSVGSMEDISYKMSGNDVIAFEVRGEGISSLPVMSVDGVSGLLNEENDAVFGFSGDYYVQTTYSCSLSLDAGYNFNFSEKNALIENCIYSLIDDTGWETKIDETKYYVENVGLVAAESEVTDQAGIYYTEEYQLVDTNVVQIINEEENVFSDLTVSHINYDAIMYLKSEGVISGYPDGTFKPANDVNRAELLKILVEGKGISPSLEEYNNCFPDVNDDWFVPYVCYAKEEGWIDGYPDGTFKPGQTVNKAEALKMLLNSQNIDVPASLEDKPFDDVNISDWFAPFVAKAKEMNILEETGSNLNPGDLMKRAGICENLYRLLIQ